MIALRAFLCKNCSQLFYTWSQTDKVDIHNIVADCLQNPSYRLAVKIVIGQFENEMISVDNDLDYQKNTLL